MQCMPDVLVGREYYYPTEQGIEVKLKARYEKIEKWKKDSRSKS